VQLRYWGKDKQVFPTIALLESVSNDYPERCFNTGLSQMESTQSNPDIRLYDKARTLSCVHCQLQRMEIILNHSVSVALEPCEVCSDWWAKVEHGSKHQIPPGVDVTKVSNVELTFELIAN
jgi:hypothetical protein